jgi:hypothetical protein
MFASTLTYPHEVHCWTAGLVLLKIFVEKKIEEAYGEKPCVIEHHGHFII